jgi:hypothetical protein
MCDKCIEAAHRYFPKVKDSDIGDLLFSATCFPFGCAGDVERQLRNLSRRKKYDGTLATAAAMADADMDRAMRRLQPNTRNQRPA